MMQELFDLCREAEVKDKRKSVENGEKVCQFKFENLSMELELNEEARLRRTWKKTCPLMMLILGTLSTSALGKLLK